MSLRTSAVFTFKDGLFFGELVDAVTDHGRRIAGLEFGGLDGPQALNAALASLRPISEPEVSITAELDPEAIADTDQVHLVTGLGGTVTAPAMRTGTPTAYRVMGHSGTEDDDGVIAVRPELATARDAIEQRYQRWFAATNNGTLDGRSATSAISSPSVTGGGIVSPIGGLDVSTGGIYSAVGDRGSARRPSEPGIIVAFDAYDDVAGASGATTYRVEVDASSIGTVTLPNTVDVGHTVLSTPVYVDTTNLVNIECTAAGGHTGVTVAVVTIPIT